MGSMSYKGNLSREGFATRVELTHIEIDKPFGLSYLEIEIHSDRRGMNTCSRSAPLL